MKRRSFVVLGLVLALLLLAGCNITSVLPKYELTITILPDQTAGSVSPASGSKFTVDSEAVLVPKPANTGWVFDHWEGPNANEVILQGNTYKIIMNSHKSLTAVFKANNQAPTVSLSATPLTGNNPLEVSFTATASDPNNDSLVYDWNFGDEVTEANGGSTIKHTYQKTGVFLAKVTVKDPAGLTATAEVTIKVEAENNNNPVAADDAQTLNEDQPVDIDVLANDSDVDGDTLTITSVTAASHGTASIVNGKIHYEPASNYFGNDSFTYTIQDGKGGTDTATVNLTIQPVNDVPVATNDIVQLPEEGSILIEVLNNDTDVDEDSLILESFTQGNSGTVTKEGNSLRYVPSANFAGEDQFTYTVSDGKGGTATATVIVTVEPVNDAPDAVIDTAEVNEDETVLINVLANDTDPDADALSILEFTQGSKGAVAQEGTALRYTPVLNFNGADSFTYKVSDGKGGVDTASVTVTVKAVNDAPVAADDLVDVAEDSDVLIPVLANDSDIEGEALTIKSFTQGSHGIVTKEGDALRYTPVANFNGLDHFTYTVEDATGAVSTANVDVEVTPVNDAPVAGFDSAVVDEDGTVFIEPLTNDTDLDGDALIIESFTQGTHGTVAKEATGLRYTPAANYNGTDSFTYTVSDGQGGTATGTINVTINAVNDGPVAVNDAVTLNEDSNLLIQVLANDSDIEGDLLSVNSFTVGSHGAVVQEGNALRYTPGANFHGSDSFTYVVKDAKGATATGTVSVTVNPVNDTPLAQNDTAQLHEGGSALINVLSNDSDIDGDTLSITSFTQGTNGTVAQEGTSLRYTVSGDFNGEDQFTYTISDGNGGTATATVVVTIDAVNDAPVAMADVAEVDEDGSVLIDVLANDTDIENDVLTISSFTQPGHGVVTVSGAGLQYRPAQNYNGSDQFTYTVSDGLGGEDTGTVTLTVKPVNDAPVAQNDTTQLNEDATVLINVLANDSDLDGDVLAIEVFTQGSHGVVTLEGDGLRYTPEENFVGADSFTYTINDGVIESATATVNVTVNPVNDAPVATDDTVEVQEDNSLLINVLTNDTDVDGDTLSITAYTQGVNGIVAKEGASLRYTPGANFNGTDSFTYDISDGNGGVATGTVNVTVNSVNDLPVVTNDSATVDEDTTVLVDVLANDSDLDGDVLTISAFTQGAHGTVAQEGDSLRYTPAENYNGADSFTYNTSDGKGGTASATVNVTINAINDAPVVANENVSVNEDSTKLVDVLVNDIDVEGDTLSITAYTQGTHGTVAQEGNSLRYTPAANYNGADSFTYTVNDGNGGVATGTVNVTVNTVNDLPVATNDNAAINEDASVLVDVLANDSDLDGDVLTISAFTQGAHGTVAQEGDSLRYTPAANYNGADSFTYNISDGNGGTASATVNVTINAINDAPVVANENVSVNEDSTKLVDVLVNDIDVEGDTLSITAYTQGTHGTVAQEGDSLRYTPAANYNGADSFTYTVDDGNGGVATGTVNVTINPINDLPVATNDNATINEDGTKLVDVLVNDSDVDGDTLSITAFTQGAHGTVAQEGDSLRYTPAANYNGADSFTYTVNDGNGGVVTGTVNVTINPVNDLPVATNDNATVNEDSTKLVDVLVNDSDVDGDTLSITGFTQGAHGTVAQEGDSLRYTPAANYNGADSFTYTVNDGNGGVVTGTVNVTINPVNDLPVATNDNATVNEDGTKLVDVLANDTDVDGDFLSLTGFTQGAHGTVAQEGDSLRYTPAANYNGADSFTYTVNDGNGGVVTGTVNVTINPVNDLPVATNDNATVNEDGTKLVDVLANDSDVDGDMLSITGFTQGAHGTVAQEGGSLRYTPAANYNGADSFTYNISDGNGGTASATVNVTINAINDAPVVVNENVSVNEDSTKLVDVLVNDGDVDGDTLSITAFTQGAHGTVAKEGDSLRYTPAANYNGADSFTYTVNDGNGGVATGTVNVTVNAVNDAPVATTDNVSVNEDSTVLIDVLANDSDVDGDFLSLTGFTQGAHGTVAQEGGSLRYTPVANYNGADSFMYEINDGNGGVRTATVNVTVNSVNDNPVANNDSATLDQDTTVLINVLANDTDLEGDALTINSVTQGAHGTVSIEGNQVRYTPDAGYSGADSFSYVMYDGNGGSATGTVNITVNSVSILSVDLDVNVSGTGGTTDFIVFTITQAGIYEIKSSFYIQACDTCVYVYDASQNLLASNDDYTDLYGCVYINLNPGTYYVKVGDFDMTHVYCHLEVTKQ